MCKITNVINNTYWYGAGDMGYKAFIHLRRFNPTNIQFWLRTPKRFWLAPNIGTPTLVLFSIARP